MAIQGVIAERTRAVLPSTWDMLEKLSTFGDVLLQRVIDGVEERIFGVAVPPAAEVQYPLIVVDYVAKLSALELISPGIDAWRATGPVSVSATGTNENTAYSDPVVALQQLRTNLLEETRKMWPWVEPLIDYDRLSSGGIPVLNTVDDEFLTPSPQEFGRPYRVTDRS